MSASCWVMDIEKRMEDLRVSCVIPSVNVCTNFYVAVEPELGNFLIKKTQKFSGGLYRGRGA